MGTETVLAVDIPLTTTDSALVPALLDAADCGLVVLDADALVVQWNTWIAERSGIRREQALDSCLQDLFPKIDGGRLIQSIDQALRQGLSSVLSPRLHKHPLPLYTSPETRLKNERLHQSVSIKLIHNDNNAMRCCLLQITDVTASVMRERTLRNQANELKTLMDEFSMNESRLRSILENTQDGVFTISDEGTIDSINPAAERIFAISRDEAMGRAVSALIPSLAEKGTLDSVLEGLAQLAEKSSDGPVEVQARRGADQFPLELSIGEISIGERRLFVGSMRDISDRKRVQDHIQHLAHYDALTDLPNRVLFQLRVDQALLEAERTGELVAVMFMDLDRFKNINDTLGHDVGDLLLQGVAKRIQACLRSMDTVARLGGDEFAVILSGLKQIDGARVVAEKLLNALSAPFRLDGHEVQTSSSIGISLFPNDDTAPGALLKFADLAMYQAKVEGRNGYRFFCEDMQEATKQKILLETDLRRAIGANEFVLQYQPRIDLASKRTVGLEALVRWIHPQRGMVSPGEFIPVAEESGLIVPLGSWVLNEACRQTVEWQNAGLPSFKTSVNLSAAQFKDPKLLQTVRDALASSGLDPTFLEFEVTESFLMENADSAIGTLHSLHELGITLSIDDFGTGYSSLAYLKRFPVDVIKIDRSFVKDIETDADDAVIVSAVIGLGHNLGRIVVAEGVETEAQVSFLEQHDCDEIQGFFFSRPLPAEKIPDFLSLPTL